MALAVSAKHPYDAPPELPDEVKKGIFSILTSSPEDFKAVLVEVCDDWEKEVQALSEDESKLHDAMPEGLQRVLAGKNLLAWKEMLGNCD